MKGITNVIAVVLLILIVIALIGFAMLFFTGVIGGAQSQTTSATEKKMTDIRSSFILLSQDGISVLMRNTGSYDIEPGFINVYLNGIQTDGFIPFVIKAGDVGSINVWDINNIEGSAGTRAELTVAGASMTQKITVIKPEEITGIEET